jgi:hypothetical protein
MTGSPEALAAPDLANTVTGFCTILSGVVALLFCATIRPQPRRWVFAYACLVFTGIPTVLLHGWGGSFFRVWDTGSNLLLAWAIQLAALGDFYSKATRWRVAVASAAVNLLAITGMIREEMVGVKTYAIDLGSFGGFHPGETVLILDALLATGLIAAQRARIPLRARPLLRLVVASFLIGVGLASASNQTLHGRIWSYHALWHVVGAFGFVLFWGFNHVRFEARA